MDKLKKPEQLSAITIYAQCPEPICCNRGKFFCGRCLLVKVWTSSPLLAVPKNLTWTESQCLTRSGTFKNCNINAGLLISSSPSTSHLAVFDWPLLISY